MINQVEPATRWATERVNLMREDYGKTLIFDVRQPALPMDLPEISDVEMLDILT